MTLMPRRSFPHSTPTLTAGRSYWRSISANLSSKTAAAGLDVAFAIIERENP
jgi:hypothetical protein